MAAIQHAYEHERIRATLAHVQELNTRATNKHLQIRINHWVHKLLDQPVANPTWRKDVLEHAAALLQMLVDGVVDEPFTKMPPQGPLPTLPRHKVAGLRVGRLSVAGCGRPRSTPTNAASRPSAQLLQRLLHEEDVSSPLKKTVETQSKQIQTTDQDDQWDWQRVWKGAFEKMRSELVDRTSQIQAMSAEMKELRALVAAQKHTLEQQDHLREDLVVKHRAEVENLRSVHTLELEALKAKHKKQLDEATLQNEKLLRDRRRERDLGGAFNMQSESYGDFLAYIDDFYTDTLRLTQTL